MSGFDDTSERNERARRLADAANHGSVTVDRLAGGDGYASSGRLYGEPPVEQFTRDEQPHFCLCNERKGIGIGDKSSTETPDAGGMTLAFLTDKRVLVLVGQEDGDEVVSIPHSTVTGADYTTGIMKHRLVIETADTDYHVWVEPSVGERTIKRVVDALEGAATRNRNRGQTPGGGPTPPDDTGGGPTPPDDTGGASTAAQSTDGSGNGSRNAGSGTSRGGSSGSAGTSGDDEPDALDKLERLKELHDRGVVTDAEFEQKKAELLDQI